MVTQYATWKRTRFGALAMAAPQPSMLTNKKSTHVLLTWFPDDPRRDADARAIFVSKKLTPISSARPYELWARCSSASQRDMVYWLTMHPTGSGTCTCLDWLYRGGACKHLRAFRMLIEKWIQGGHLLPNSFSFPRSLTDAEAIETRNCTWYGENYSASVTSPLLPVVSDSTIASSRTDAAQPETTAGMANNDPSELPAHLKAARSSEISVTHEKHTLPPPTHPISLEAEARMSEILEPAADSIQQELQPHDTIAKAEVCTKIVHSTLTDHERLCM